jgi:hypothetical protein
VDRRERRLRYPHWFKGGHSLKSAADGAERRASLTAESGPSGMGIPAEAKSSALASLKAALADVEFARAQAE